MSRSGSRPYRLFEVVGLELEYPIVDETLAVRSLVADAFAALHGRPTSDVERRHYGYSNELADHVFEVKNPRPLKSVVRAEADLVAGVQAFSKVLHERFSCRLMPTGMHPFMDPRTGRTWPRAGRRIYETYAKVFPLATHGWMNVQSCHVNLPFGTEEETLRMLDAAACLIPYLPALSASSPAHDGRLGPHVDNRLAFYRVHQQRVPETMGRVVPEHVASFRQYRSEVLGGIYRALRQIPDAAPLRHEFANARGAILRFMRSAMEVRVLDAQECVHADAALAAFTRAALAELTDRLADGRLERPTDDTLVADFHAVVEQGRAASVAAPHLRPARGRSSGQARATVDTLLELAEPRLRDDERRYLPLLADRARRGNLSERIRAKVRRSRRDERASLEAIYRELMDCLEANEPWQG